MRYSSNRQVTLISILTLSLIINGGLSSILFSESLFHTDGEQNLEGIYFLALQGDKEFAPIVGREIWDRPLEQDRMGLLFGYPRRLLDRHLISGRSPVVVDIDRNGDWELGVVSGNGRLYLYQHDGAYYPGFPTPAHRGGRPWEWIDLTHQAHPAVGSISGGERQVIAYITDLGFLHILDEMGEEPYPFPLDLGIGRRWGGVVSSDLDNDGNSEFIFTHYAQYRDSLGLTAVIGVINSRGEYREGFPVIIPNAFISSPAVGDINGDGNLEIVVGIARRDSALCSITAYSHLGEELNGFPREIFSAIGATISLVDKDRDGRCEIFFWGRDIRRGQGGIWGLTGTGEVLENFPLLTRKGHPWGGVAIADVEGDGSWEFAFGTYDPEGGAQVYLWGENGALMRGFPVSLESPSVVGSLVIEDVSGEGSLDIVVATSPYDNIPSQLIAYNHRGEIIEGFPLSLDDWGGWGMGGTPTLYDLNRDGNTDILAITTEGTLFAWATGGRFTGQGWFTEKGFFNRSGCRPVRQGLLRAEFPALTPSKNTFRFFPQPFNGTGILSINLSHPQEVNIKLYELQGRELTTLYHGYLASGTHTIPINLALFAQPSGFYFLVSNLTFPTAVIYLP